VVYCGDQPDLYMGMEFTAIKSSGGDTFVKSSVLVQPFQSYQTCIVVIFSKCKCGARSV